MAKGQEQRRIIIAPPVPGTPEYYSHLRQQRDLLPVEKQLGMIRDPQYCYAYRQKYEKPLFVSCCLYLAIILMLFYALWSISIAQTAKPILIELSFGDPQSELMESIEVITSGIENDIDTPEIGATDIEQNDIQPEPEQVVEEKNDSFENSFNEYVESIQPSENIEQPLDVASNSSETLNSLSSSVSQAVSTNRADSAQYGSGDSMEFRLAKAGAQTGEIQISLFWNTTDDIDLHVYYTPGNGLSDIINWKNRFGRLSGGILDVDMNAQGPQNSRCVENVFWPYGSSPRGMFVVQAQFFRCWSGLRNIPIIIRIKTGNNIQTFNANLYYGTSPSTITKFSY